MSKRQLALNAFILPTGHHIAAWRRADVPEHANHDFGEYVRVARLAEAAKCGAADGFNVLAPWLPGGLEEFIELVVPELRRRGLFREEYSGSTLREHLGLTRPENRHAAERDRRAAS